MTVARPPKKVAHASALGTIRLRFKASTGALTYVQRGGNQSAVDRNGTSLDTYIHALFGLILQRPTKRALMIGCGGGTLGRMLAAAGIEVTIVDIDKASFRLAKRYFALPREVACHVGDGLAFMQETRRRFDVLIVDAFIGEKIPPHMTAAALSSAARRCLRQDGSLFMNVCLDDRADRAADVFGLGFRKDGWTVRLFDQPGGARNAVILAGNVKTLRRPKLLHVPDVEAGRIKRELGRMRFRRLRAAA